MIRWRRILNPASFAWPLLILLFLLLLILFLILIDIRPVITHRFHYTEFHKGFEVMMSSQSGKVILDWTETG